MRRILAAALAGLWTAAAAVADPLVRNGFRLESSSIDTAEIVAGGPPRDGIPALDHPASVTASRSAWDDDEIVIGVALEGEARAYPLSILLWHELVNDTLGGVPILVSFCPLCGTAMVFDRRIAGEARSFGVSGLLYRSDLLLFDRETGSLWSQIAARAVTGSAEGQRLGWLPSRMLPWKTWRERHPQSRILNRETGYTRRYGQSPYGDYALSEELLFPVGYDRRFHPKMPTLGLRAPDGRARAYPASELVRAGGQAAERFAGQPVRVRYDPQQQVFDFEIPAGIEAIEGFWFAWSAFHPESSVFTAPDPQRPGASDR